MLYLCTAFGNTRAFSSAGSEHLPYKQRVGGSNPSTPTSRVSFEALFFVVAGQGLGASGVQTASLALVLSSRRISIKNPPDREIRRMFVLIKQSFLLIDYNCQNKRRQPADEPGSVPCKQGVRHLSTIAITDNLYRSTLQCLSPTIIERAAL